MKTDFEILSIMAKENKDIVSSTNLIQCRKVKQGAILEIGVDYNTMHKIGMGMTKNGDSYSTVVYVVNMKEFNEIKNNETKYQTNKTMSEQTEPFKLCKVYCDNGELSHYVLIDVENGEKLWSEDPKECEARGFPVKIAEE